MEVKHIFNLNEVAQTGFKHKATQDLWHIFTEYDLSISTDGDFIANSETRIISRNQLRYALMHDYETRFGKVEDRLLLRGHIDALFDGLIHATNNLLKRPDLLKPEELIVVKK